MKTYFDTNVLVAAFQPDHIHHNLSFAAFTQVRNKNITGYMSGHGLVEFYSVLTRTPFPVPVPPSAVLPLVEQSILPYFNIIEVTTQSHLAALTRCATSGWRGGRIHDAVHIQAAIQAGCDAIYTYNLAEFQNLAPEWSARIQNPPPA